MNNSNIYWSSEIEHVAELVKGKLYFGRAISAKPDPIKNTPEVYYFNIDEEYVYLNYYLDFGPLNISCLYKYCLKLYAFIHCPQLKRIVHYTCNDPIKHVNGAFLIGSYCVIYMNMDPKLVYKKLLECGGHYKAFMDASQGISRYTLKLVECLQGIQKARIFNFFSFEDFSASEYDLYDKIENGDFNWIVPRKFLALIGPVDKELSPNGHSPSFYIKYFLKNDVKAVVRLNNKLYNPYIFSSVGIDHYDLFFPDGTTPPKHILMKFLQISENTNGALAVHCKAGLGRTGCLIGAYIMKHYQFTAKEAIAWMRICRPGCVIGQQQGWLEKIEPWLWKEGRLYRLSLYGSAEKLPHNKYGIYSKEWQKKRKKFLQKLHKRTLSEVPPRNGMTKVEEEVMRLNLRERQLLKLNPSIMCSSKENKYSARLTPDAAPSITQGDKLNEIKFRQYYNSFMKKPPSLGNSNREIMFPSNSQSPPSFVVRQPPFISTKVMSNATSSRVRPMLQPLQKSGRVPELTKKFNYYSNLANDHH